jgi:potassium channel subfamily K
MAARIVEKRRESAVHNVDGRKQTIKVSWFAQADFSSDPALTPAQRREEEFRVMRKVQKAAERERRYFALATSLILAITLWMVGALIFTLAERAQGWTYFQSLYFTFIVLMTIGYGDFSPASNAGKAFFVMWSLLAIPSLTILISNMADTVVKWIADVTEYVASITVLPGPGGARKTGRTYLGQLTDRASEAVERYTPFGKDKSRTKKHLERMDPRKHDEEMLIMLSEKLERHVEEEEIKAAMNSKDSLEKDVHFYNFVLSKELRKLQKDVLASPPKEYSWHDWEYYLKLMGDEDDDFDDQSDTKSTSNDFIPGPLKPANTFREPNSHHYALDGTAAHKLNGPYRTPAMSHAITFPTSPVHVYNTPPTALDGVTDRKSELRSSHQHPHHQHHQSHLSRTTTRTHRLRRRPTTSDDPLRDWSWLSDQSPLMSSQSEAEWILERLSRALERELERQRKGRRRKRPPPVGWGSVERGRSIEKGRKEG